MKNKVEIAEGVFLTFKEENNGKLSFSSENEILQRWVESCITQRVSEEKKKYVVSAAKKFLQTGVKEGKARKSPEETTNTNPVSMLNLRCQKYFRANILFEIVNVSGMEHCPEVEVKLVLPDGTKFYAVGKNQRLARMNAARAAMDYVNLYAEKSK